jgi:hypothetical protein
MVMIRKRRKLPVCATRANQPKALKRTTKFIGRYATYKVIHKWKDVGNDKALCWRPLRRALEKRF